MLEVYLIVVCVVVVSVSYLALLTNFCVSHTCMETYMFVIKRWWPPKFHWFPLTWHKLYYSNKYASPWIRWDRILDASMTFFFDRIWSKRSGLSALCCCIDVLLQWCCMAKCTGGGIQEGFWLLGEWKGVNMEETWGWHGAGNQGKGVINEILVKQLVICDTWRWLEVVVTLFLLNLVKGNLHSKMTSRVAKLAVVLPNWAWTQWST